MRHHTDRPIPALRATRPILATPPVEIDRVSAGGRLGLRIARAFYRRRLRAYRRERTGTADAD